jgi:hypothetical protein
MVTPGQEIVELLIHGTKSGRFMWYWIGETDNTSRFYFCIEGLRFDLWKADGGTALLTMSYKHSLSRKLAMAEAVLAAVRQNLAEGADDVLWNEMCAYALYRLRIVEEDPIWEW